jgi:hypothetical protein
MFRLIHSHHLVLPDYLHDHCLLVCLHLSPSACVPVSAWVPASECLAARFFCPDKLSLVACLLVALLATSFCKPTSASLSLFLLTISYAQCVSS